jgi:hypothetical protein
VKKLISVLAVTTLVLTAISCEKKTASPAPATGTAQAAVPPGHPGSTEVMPGVNVVPAEGKLTGEVLEAVDARSFTYIRLKTAEGERWAAVNRADVKVGSTITVETRMRSDKFESAHLKRTFENVYFGNIEGAAPAGDGAGMMGGHSMSPETPEAPLAPVSVAKAEGANGRTVGEIWTGKDSLNGKPVVVRGQVVKFLANIMGKNWIHLRDGSGAAGTNDLTITTADSAKVGDVVVVSGTVKTNADFGAGYNYEVIVENAKVSK